MNTVALKSSPTLAFFASVSLADELRMRGIHVLDRELVKNHKQSVIEAHRDGIWRYLGGVVYGIRKIHHAVFQSIESMLIALIASTALLAFSFILVNQGVLPTYVADLAIYSVGGGWGFLIAYTIFFNIILFVGATMLTTFGFVDASAIWIREPMKFDSKITPHNAGMTRLLYSRGTRAASIPGAKVKIERFLEDPFLLVTRRRGLIVETAYIGAWNTGNPVLDNE